MFTFFKNFANFNREIKIIALITLINRMGTVVVPFLSKYLKEDLNLSYTNIGWIMVCFGLGSLVGTFLSGKLSDYFGPYKVMVFSLFFSGILFILLRFVASFSMLCLLVFLLTTIADMYRPAMMLTVTNYVQKEMRLQSLSLIRAANNLGLVVGPLLGAVVILNKGYGALFFIDGITCIVAISFFVLLVKEKKLLYKLHLVHQEQDKFAPLKDTPFVFNWIIAMITGYLFFQVFSILPIYHKAAYQLSELDSGMFLGFSGLLFILFEISVVNFVQKNKIADVIAIMIGLLLISASYALLFLIHQPWVFWIFMVLITFGNMLTFTFASGFVMKRSHKNHEGLFMSTFQMSYGFAHVFSSKTGLTIIQKFDFDANWTFNFVLALGAALFAYYMFLKVQKEDKKIKEKIAMTLFK